MSTDEAIVQLELSPNQPLGPLKHLTSYTANIEGFATAGEAEARGLKLSLALLWSAITRDFTMRLNYHTPLPCVVYDRTQSGGGISLRAYGTVYFPATATDLAELMGEVLTTSIPVDRQLLLSMEIFAAAKLEISDRAKFLDLVSSLEPLAAQANYPDSVLRLVDGFRAQVESTDLANVSQEEASRIKTLLDGRLKDLERESIRQALLLTIREVFPGDNDSLKTIDDAYALRSKMLHEGTTDPYLDRKTHAVETILRRLYATRIGKPLRVG